MHLLDLNEYFQVFFRLELGFELFSEFWVLAEFWLISLGLDLI